MTSTVEELVTFFRSDYWAENIDLLHRSDLTLHEVMLSTSVHPVTLEFLFDRYLAAMGKDVVNVGHAVVGNRGLVKYYTADRPSFFLMWTYGEDALIGPDPDGSTVLLGDAGERSYIDDVRPEADQRLRPRRHRPLLRIRALGRDAREDAGSGHRALP